MSKEVLIAGLVGALAAPLVVPLFKGAIFILGLISLGILGLAYFGGFNERDDHRD
jgi:uncharacterized membrane protein